MKLVYRLEDEIIDKDKKIKQLKSEITKYKNLILSIHKQTLCVNKILNLEDDIDDDIDDKPKKVRFCRC
jgi:hypothetical protein